MKPTDRLRSLLIYAGLLIAGYDAARLSITALASGIQALATVPAGGTGLTTLTLNSLLAGNGTSPVQLIGNPADNTKALCGSNPPAFGSTCTGSGGGGITVFSGTALTITANTYYLPIGGGALPSTTETNVDVEAPSAATITNFNAQLSVAFGVGNSGVFTWRKAASSQSLTCTISGASATTCSDNTHSFTVAQGDLIDVQLVTTGTIIVTPNLVMSVQFGTTGSNGTVNTGTINQLGYYAANGTAISGGGSAQVIATFTGCSGVQYLGADGACHAAGGGGNYTLISDQLLGAPAATVTFSSLGSNKHLKLFMDARCSAASISDHYYIQVNGDTGNNYSTQYFVATTTTTFQGQFLSTALADLGDITCSTGLANSTVGAEVAFYNYAGTTFTKQATALLDGTAGNATVTGLSTEKWAWHWASTAAITSITVGVVGGSNFVTNSRFTLYGLN